MTSQEDYEYSAFRCAFCKTLNPAKKLRPIAPRLAQDENNVAATASASTKQPSDSSNSPTSSEKDSG